MQILILKISRYNILYKIFRGLYGGRKNVAHYISNENNQARVRKLKLISSLKFSLLAFNLALLWG